MIEEEKRWYAPDPMEDWSRTVDSLPINDSVWLRLYEKNLRTVADVADAYHREKKAKTHLAAAFRVAGEPKTADPITRLDALNCVYKRLDASGQTPLASWPFDTRTLNALKGNRIETLAQLVFIYPSEFLLRRGLGFQRLAECRQMVAFYNLCFGLR